MWPFLGARYLALAGTSLVLSIARLIALIPPAQALALYGSSKAVWLTRLTAALSTAAHAGAGPEHTAVVDSIKHDTVAPRKKLVRIITKP